MKYLNRNNTLSTSQYGFRQNISTEDAVTALTSFITNELDSSRKCLTVFLDLKKAFDTVSFPILLTKLENIGIRGTQLALMNSYLHGRTQRVRIGDLQSCDSEITFGIPQGSVLGPTLFLIYINELTNMNIDGGKVYSYADDTAVVFSASEWPLVFSKAESGLTLIATRNMARKLAQHRLAKYEYVFCLLGFCKPIIII